MDLEMKSMLCLIALLVLSKIVNQILNDEGIIDKKARIYSDLLIIIGGLFVSFYLFREEQSILKHAALISGLIYLAEDSYQFIKPKSEYDKMKEDEEQFWAKEKSKIR